MILSKEAEENKPKKPLNAYIKFRTDKLHELKDQADRVAQAKSLWDNIDPDEKKELEKEFHEEMDEYKIKFEAWKKKYNVSDDYAKRKSKKKRDDSEEIEQKKSIKTKGTKQPKEEEKKKEEPKKNKSAQKDKGKSKKEQERKKK